MRNSLIVICFFLLGCIMGMSALLPDWFINGRFGTYALYTLLFFVGVGIGCDKELKNIFRNFSPKLLLVPIATIIGSLIFSALTALILTQWDVAECMAVGSGFAYYSLSSILITELKEAELGIALATELGTIALMANILREVITLVATPLIVKRFGPLAPICAGGATTADTTFPIISQNCGREFFVIAIVHGILVDMSVPFLVTFFCSL